MAYIIGYTVAAAVGYYLGGKVEARFSEDNDSIRSFLDAHEREMDSRI